MHKRIAICLLFVFILSAGPLTKPTPAIAQDGNEEERPACESQIVLDYSELASSDLDQYATLFQSITSLNQQQAIENYIASIDLTHSYQDIDEILPECLLGYSSVMQRLLTNYTYALGIYIIALSDQSNMDTYTEVLQTIGERNTVLTETIASLTVEILSQVETED